MTTVAIMQPYFLPYAGYFRLMAAADLFVIYDCVQFPRRGWVHRNRLQNAAGELDWLTLPLHHPPWQARIDTIRLAKDAPERLTTAIRRFPCLSTPLGQKLVANLVLFGSEGAPLLRDYLDRQLRGIADLLGLSTPFLCSSTLGLESNLQAQDRILNICQRLGATRYINAPGGVDLYDVAAFNERGIELVVLPPWHGAFDSVLQRILEDGPQTCGRAIKS
ncbi:WbqC family protein [Azospirillum sp. TSA6c]|uniref:WbqC family protein n=1 Tax=unclassified Azospirillum TaxID=2630922 RepID=UPI000D654DD1|nr:WbqC family protein [Azospirillum sp. TSA6c]